MEAAGMEDIWCAGSPEILRLDVYSSGDQAHQVGDIL
jgi:hypothetical protein